MRSLVARIASHTSAWANLSGLRALTLENCSIEEIAEGVYNYAGGFFRPDQIHDEIIVALREVQSIQPRYVVEIGTSGGGTLLLWSRVAHPEAVIVSIDLHSRYDGIGASRLRAPLFRRMGLKGQRIHPVAGDSHHPETLARVRGHLANNSVDFLFIDGDHTEKGVRADYEMYGPLVRPGGIIAFHDIAIDAPGFGVRNLWRELARSARTRSIVGREARYGIGLLYC